MNSAAKFRPYFTSIELSHLISRLKTHHSQSPLDISLIKYLETFAIKIERGVLTPGHTPVPTKKECFISSLDLDGESNLSAQELVNRASRAKELYFLWMNPTRELTPRELELVMEYRYENDLMTPEEENKFEEYTMNVARNKLP